MITLIKPLKEPPSDILMFVSLLTLIKILIYFATISIDIYNLQFITNKIQLMMKFLPISINFALQLESSMSFANLAKLLPQLSSVYTI